MTRQLVDLWAIDAPIEHFGPLRFAAHHEVHRKSAEIPVLERQRLLDEHGARHAAIAIDQRETTRGFLRQNVRRQGQDRCDAAACGKRDIRELTCRIDLRAKSAGRRADFEHLSGPHRACQLSGHAAARLHSHAELQDFAAGSGYDRISATLLSSGDAAPHGHVLTRVESEGTAQCRRNGERDAHRVFRDALDRGHRQRMEGQHGVIRCI